VIRLPGLALGLLVQSEVFDGRQVGLNNSILRRGWARSWSLDLLETLEDRIDLAISAEAVVGTRTGEMLRGTVRSLASKESTEAIPAAV
jgi:hypothetical protein